MTHKKRTTVRIFARSSIALLAVSLLSVVAEQSIAKDLDGILVRDNTNDLHVEDDVLNLGGGLNGQGYPIVFDTDESFSIIFDKEPGTVYITEAKYLDGAINASNSHTVNLSIVNGSLDIRMNNGEAWESQAVITMNWGSSLSVDRDLLIDFTVATEASRFEGGWPYAAIMAGGVSVDVKGSTTISLSRETMGTGGQYLAGLYLSQGTAQPGDDVAKPVEWNFGETNSTGDFIIERVQTLSKRGSAQSTGIFAAGIESSINVQQSAQIREIRAYSESQEQTAAALAYGIFSQNTALNFYGDTVIEEVHAVSANDAYAIGAEIVNADVVFHDSLTIRNVSAWADDSVTLAWKQCSSGTCGSKQTAAYAIGSYAKANVRINPDAKKDAVVKIENDLTAGDGGMIKANFANADSHFYGSAVTSPGVDDLGRIELSFGDGANWRLSKSNTHPVDLTLADNAAVYLNRTSNGNTKEHTKENASTLTLSSLNGENSTFHLSTAVNEAYGDSINITSGSGSFGLMVQGTGEEPTEVALNRALVRAEEGNIEFSLANDGGVVDLGNYVYGLASRTDEKEKAKEWYLTNQTTDNPDPEEPDNPDVPVDPDEPGGETEGEGGHPVLSPSATAVLALAGSGTQTSQFLYGLSDIRKRMGDVRQKAADGLYAIARGGKNRISGFASTSFKDEYGALSIGFDRKFASNWIAGAVFEAIEGDQTVRSNGYKAEGESSTQALKGYLSWFGEKGAYADVVFGVSYFDQDINTKMLDGTGVSGGFSGWGWGASVEAGHQFLMDSDPTWFIEPQVQLSYFRVQGDSFALTNAMRVDQDDADSLTGRLGLVVGRTILTDSGSGWQFSVKGGLAHEFLDEADIHVNGERFTGSTLGTRGYYGVAFDWYASDAVRVFGQIEREEGAHYTSEINARIGVKYCF